VQGAERPPGPAPDPAEALALRQAIAALPARKRECVVLRYLIGMTEAETAQVLDVSVGTVKSQTHKGLSQLRDHLDALLATEEPGADSPIAPERKTP
jgi:DNA-directed RNA polymerase specialized sigma24 family protein